MNDIQSLIDRQLGIYCRLNYDNVLKRLAVSSDESFYGLQSGSVVPSFDQDPPIFACRFAEKSGYEHILALANEDGKVAIQDITSVKTASALESYQCHYNAIFDLAWMPGHMSFVTVSGDHTARVWDLATGSPRRVAVLASHSRSVKCAAFQPSAGALATGARDGHVLLWDLRARAAQLRLELRLRPDNRLSSCHSPRVAAPAPAARARREPPRAASITGLAFQDDMALLTCGECDPNIKVWDLRKNYSVHTREPLPRYAIPYPGSSARAGYASVTLDTTRSSLYASCMDGVIYRFNVTAEGAPPERRYAGHENGTFYIKAAVSADGEYLASGSSDKLAYIWSVHRAEPLVRLAGHRAEVTCVAWGPRSEPALVTCGDDARHMIWRLGPEEQPPDAMLAGRAEPAPRAPPAPLPAWGTPSGARRPRRTPPPHARPPKGKRCLAAMLGAIRESDDTAPAEKRGRQEAGIKRPRETTPPSDDAVSVEKRARQEATGTKRPRETTPPPAWAGTPRKRPRPSPRRKRSPSPPHSPHSPHKVRVVSFSPPTRDLPDFVSTGEAPHLRLMSPAKKKPDTEDWLTRLAREIRPSAPPTPLSPRENLPPRRTSVSDRTPKSNKKGVTLLKYFTVAAKEK